MKIVNYKIYVDIINMKSKKNNTTYYYLTGVFLVHIKEMKNGKEKYEKLYKELEEEYNKTSTQEHDFDFWIRIGKRKEKESEI